MEYVQLTLDDWLNIKEKLRKELQGVSEGFIRIGYHLKRIKEERLFEKDGYKDINSFAKAEYGLHPSTVSRFIAINTKYSIDGNSEYIRPEFAGMGSTKLAEMLTLPDSDLEMIRPESTRESIRELKQFNREAPEVEIEPTEENGTLETIVEEFFRMNPELLNEIYEENLELPEMVDRINPAGNRTFRTGLYYVSMFGEPEGIKVKQFGQTPQSVSWKDFGMTMDILFARGSGKNTWKEHYGGLEEPEETKEEVSQNTGKTPKPEAEETKPEEIPENPPEEPEKPAETVVQEHSSEEKEPEPETTENLVAKEPGKPFAPAQENRINTRPEDDSEEEENMGEPEEEPEEKKIYISRKKYMESMDPQEMADYLNRHLSVSTLKSKIMLTNWLAEQVPV